MTTHRHTEDSKPSEDRYTRPHKTLAKNAEKNVMFYYLTGWHFLWKGRSQIYKKSASIKLQPPILATKILWPPHHRYTLPSKQAKIVLKVFSNKINTLSVVILWLPTFWSSKNFMTPLFFFPKIYDPQYIWDPPSRENASPLRGVSTLRTSMDFIYYYIYMRTHESSEVLVIHRGVGMQSLRIGLILVLEVVVSNISG